MMRTRTLVLAVIGFVLGLGITVWSAFAIQGGVSSQQVAQASQLIVQIDSFLAAGSIIGFFQFYGRFVRSFSIMSRSISHYQVQVNQPETTETAEAVHRQIADVRVSVVWYPIGTVASFVVSGVLAVIGIFSSNPYAIPAALLFTLTAVVVMLSSWLDLARANADLETSVLKGVEMMKDELKPKPDISIENPRVPPAGSDGWRDFVFDVVNKGKVPAENFLIQGKIKGESADFAPLGMGGLPHLLRQNDPQTIVLARINKGEELIRIWMGKGQLKHPLNRDYVVEIEYVYQGVEPKPSSQRLVIVANEEKPELKIE